MEIELNKSHEVIFSDTNRFLVSYGGAGSGKSYSVAQKILLRTITEKNHRFLITRKVAKTLRVSVFQLFKDLIVSLNLWNSFTINKTDMTITYKNNNSQLLFFGLDDIEKLKSIQGITGIWIEEASECDENDIAELDRRLRGHTEHYKQIIVTFNPISHLHWLKARFFDNPASTATIHKTTYLDNSFIDEEYRERIEDIKNYDIQQYNIYALGEWGVLNSNIVYHNYNYKKHNTALTIDDFDVLHIGIDFNISACCCVASGIRDGKVYAVHAWHSYDTDAIVTELMKLKHKTLVLYPDASGRSGSTNSSRSDIKILEDAGFRVDAPPSNGAVRDRINATNRMFATDRIFINDRLEKLNHALQTQAYTDKGEPEKFNEHKGGAIDDWNDAFTYFIVRKFPLTGGKVSNSDFIMR